MGRGCLVTFERILIKTGKIRGFGAMAGKFFTIGYEGASLEDFLATLKRAGVLQLVDIRDFPGSRRKGFSKNALREALEAEGIGYEHLKGLGDPKAGRIAARAGRFEEFVAIFSAHMKTKIALADLKKAADLVTRTSACLLCYERDNRTCHRNIVSKKISAMTGLTVRNLGVRHGLAQEFNNDEEPLAAYA